MNNLSYNDIVNLALEHGFVGNPRGTKKADLIEFINTNPKKEDTMEEKEPVNEELHEEMKAETKAEELEQKVEDPVAEVKKEDPAPKKKNLVTEARRQSTASLVEDKLKELVKPIEHTKLFYEIYGEDYPEGKDAVTKWRDIGSCLTNLVNTGKVISKIPDGKKRTAFTWKHEEVVAVAEVVAEPESTNTEGEGI
jgi:hypothetical protein